MTQTSAAGTVATWNIDPAHTTAEFKVRHMMIANVKGKFSGISGTLHLDAAGPERSSVEARIPVATISTGDGQRDAHLKSADFFDVEKFPQFAFQSTGVKRTAPGELAVTGDLTMHGVTKTVTFAVEGPTEPIKDPWGNQRVALSATAKINRKDFGLTWNATLETGGLLVGEEVAITIDAEFVKA